MHCHPFRFDYSDVAFQLIKAVSEGADCNDLRLLPHPWPSSELLGLIHHARPRLLPRHFAWPSPSAAWTLSWPIPSFAFSGRFPLFKEQAISYPIKASLCPMDWGYLFGLPHGLPLHASFFPPWPWLPPCPWCSLTPQPTLWVSPTLVSPDPHRQLTQASGNHSLPQLLLVFITAAHLPPLNICLLLKGTPPRGPPP